MSDKFLKVNIDGVHVPQFQPNYICDTTHHLNKNLFNTCHEVHYMLWVHQELELQ